MNGGKIWIWPRYAKCLVGNGLAYRLTVLRSWSFDECLWVLIVFFSCFAFITLWPSCPSVQTAVRVKSSWFKKLRVLLISEFVWVSWNLLESPSVFSPFSPEIFSTWLVECTGAPAMAHIADVPRQGPHSSDCSDSICMDTVMKCSMKCYLNVMNGVGPVTSLYYRTTCTYRVHSYASTILKAFPENWVVTVQHCGPKQRSWRPRSRTTWLLGKESPADFPTASLCHDMSWYVMHDSVWLSMTMHYDCYESPGSR